VDVAEPDFVRASVDAGMLEALSESLRFGPMTRRRLRAAAGLANNPL
jgi:hypothetical protein